MPFSVVTAHLFLQLLVTGVSSGSQYALLGVSFGIIYSTTRIFHIANTVVYTFAAYGAALTVQHLGFPLVPALVVGLLVAIATGVLIELGVYRPMRARGGTLLTVFLASLGLTIAAQNGIQLAVGSATIPLPGFPLHTISIGSITFTTLDITQVVLAAVLIGGLIVWLHRSRYGHAISAVRSNKEVAVSIGISVERIYILVFAVGSVFAGVAALLFAMGSVASSSMGTQPILYSFIAVFLGGVDSVAGAALGGLIVGLAASLTSLFLSGDYSPVIVFGVLYLVLLVRPNGLLGVGEVTGVKKPTFGSWGVRTWRSSTRPE
ncbi:MAG TPA: branched-chain amino acid ABC transporter permease [Solirubrobacteraceae bacterium]|jgi:branched-chain amino acid transport system permease protein